MHATVRNCAKLYTSTLLYVEDERDLGASRNLPDSRYFVLRKKNVRYICPNENKIFYGYARWREHMTEAHSWTREDIVHSISNAAWLIKDKTI